MKTNNIFDHMDRDIDDISEQTIVEDTGVNEERIREIVMKDIHSSSKKKTGKKSRTVFVIAAAAAAVIAAGTVTAGATGSFNSVFARIFAGDPVNGMYSRSSATVTSDDVSIDFQGVAGDKRSAYAIYNITKKDGTPFIKDDASFVSLTQAANDGGSVAEVSCTIPLFDKLTEGLFYRPDHPGGDVYYETLDNNTLQAFMQFRDEGRNIIGQTVTVRDDDIVVYHTDEIILERDKIVKNVGEEYTEEEADNYERVYSEAEKRLKNGQEITFDPDLNLVIATPEVVSINYELSFPLNYKEITKSFDVDGRQVTVRGIPSTVTSMEALPLSMRINVSYNSQDQDYLDKLSEKYESEVQQSYKSDELEITLEGGETYTFDNPPIFISDFTERVTFDYTKDFRQFAIDPEKIVKVSFNGTVLYEK